MAREPVTAHGFRIRPLPEVLTPLDTAGLTLVEHHRVGPGPDAFHLLVTMPNRDRVPGRGRSGRRASPGPRGCICDRLGTGAVKSLFWRWSRRLPSLFIVADLRAGYTYELAVRQFEVSDTLVFNRPAAGRPFFEGVLRDHLDIGRPSQVKFMGRPPTGWRFAVPSGGILRITDGRIAEHWGVLDQLGHARPIGCLRRLISPISPPDAGPVMKGPENVGDHERGSASYLRSSGGR